MDNMPDNLVKSKELKVALEAALEAGKILERHLETDIIKSMKHDKSISVLADGESEEMIKKIIFVEKIELGDTGKKSRKKMAEIAQKIIDKKMPVP